MPTFTVTGKIEPPWFVITFDLVPIVSYRITEVDIDLKCSISIKESTIVATCETNRWEQETTVSWVLPYLFDWISAEINLFSFSSGKMLNVYLDSCIYPDGSTHHLIGIAPDLAALCTVCKVTDTSNKVYVEMNDLLPIVMGNPSLMLAMHDLVSALRFGNNSLTNCGRSIEALRKSLWEKDESDKAEQQQAWEHFRNTLHLSKSFLQAITDASCGPRHGSSAYICSSTRQDVLRKSWTVMNRFLLYRLGGDQPLSEKEYPML